MYPQIFFSTWQENKQIFSKNKACKIWKKKKKNKSVLVPGGFCQQISVAWCFVDQNSIFKMYFSNQIRQIKLKKKKLQRNDH